MKTKTHIKAGPTMVEHTIGSATGGAGAGKGTNG
jgi:hypothetical protein